VIYAKNRARTCIHESFLMEFLNSGELRRRRRRSGSPEKRSPPWTVFYVSSFPGRWSLSLFWSVYSIFFCAVGWRDWFWRVGFSLIHARWICLTDKSTDLTPFGLGRTVDHQVCATQDCFCLTAFFLLVDFVCLGRTYYLHPTFFTFLLCLHPPPWLWLN
jgi:hypothetical protein